MILDRSGQSSLHGPLPNRLCHNDSGLFLASSWRLFRGSFRPLVACLARMSRLANVLILSRGRALSQYASKWPQTRCVCVLSAQGGCFPSRKRKLGESFWGSLFMCAPARGPVARGRSVLPRSSRASVGMRRNNSEPSKPVGRISQLGICIYENDSDSALAATECPNWGCWRWAKRRGIGESTRR